MISKNLISKKKEVYPTSDFLRAYLRRYGRLSNLGVRYQDLLRYSNSVPLYDELGNDTLWSTVLYQPTEQIEIHNQLRYSYATLKAEGDLSIAEHLYIDRVDLCLYGNTLPFRVRIVNSLNDNFDYFYVKRVDANRIYGLELEHILSPNRINYLVKDDTILEEHIVGIPADVFMRENMPDNRFDLVRLAKEFVKFNERCFIRLLGDMHSGNFVVDITRDFEKWHYRMRPIDFDQQSHHWRKQVYLPRHFSQNKAFLEETIAHLALENVQQYQIEERALIAKRVRVSHGRFNAIMEVMREDIISSVDHVSRLKKQLEQHYSYPAFKHCQTMGDLVFTSMQHLLGNLIPRTLEFHNDMEPEEDA